MKSFYSLILIISSFWFCALSVHAQDDYNSIDELLYDVHIRQYEKPIKFLNDQLYEIETLSLQDAFPDSMYIGMTTLLSSIYMRSDQLYAADSILSHAINFMLVNSLSSELIYSLYTAYGGLNFQLKNYELASKYLDKAVGQIEGLEGKSENYAVVLSILSVCNMELGQLNLALNQITNCLNIIDSARSVFSVSSRLGIYQKAGAVFHELGMIDKAEEFTSLSYDLSNGSDFVSEHINAGMNLCTMQLNSGDYSGAMKTGKELEQLPLRDVELANIYEKLYLSSYYLGNVLETSNYASLYSNKIKNNVCSYYSSFPNGLTDNDWEQQSMALKVAMGIMDKCGDDKCATEMCYDNSLFLKTMRYHYSTLLRESISKDDDLVTRYSAIKELRSTIFAGNNDDEQLSQQYTKLLELEQAVLRTIINDCPIDLSIGIKTWKDVQASLHEGECAIEFVTVSGFQEDSLQHKSLYYGALILKPEYDAPKFVELCKFSDLYDVEINALREFEFGINTLYEKRNNTLYHLVWENIDPYLKNTDVLYLSPILGIQNLSIGYIPCPNNQYLNEIYNIHIVPSTESVIYNKETSIEGVSNVCLFGDIDYGSNSSFDNRDNYSLRSIILEDYFKDTRSGFNRLSGTAIEVDSIADILSKNNQLRTDILKGVEATELALRNFDGNSPSIIHFSTHGFYLVGFESYKEYFKQLVPYSDKDESLLYTGLLFSGANESFVDHTNHALNDGIITAEEISAMDLSKTDIVVLSACDSSLGITQEGYGGLPKAFLLAGAKHLVVSLWKVPDTSTALLMTELYRNLVAGMDLHSALLAAQKTTSQSYPDPYYYAGFYVLN